MIIGITYIVIVNLLLFDPIEDDFIYKIFIYIRVALLPNVATGCLNLDTFS